MWKMGLNLIKTKKIIFFSQNKVDTFVFCSLKPFLNRKNTNKYTGLPRGGVAGSGEKPVADRAAAGRGGGVRDPGPGSRLC